MVKQLALGNIGGVAKLFGVGLIVQILCLRRWIRQTCSPCPRALLEVGVGCIDAVEEAIPEFVGVVRCLCTGIVRPRQSSGVQIEKNRGKSKCKRITRESPAGEWHGELLRLLKWADAEGGNR